MQLVVDLQIFSCQTSSPSDKTAVENKTFLRKKAQVSTAKDPHLANQIKMKRSVVPLPKDLVEMTGVEPATP